MLFKLLIFQFLLLASVAARAEAVVDINYFMFTDTMKYSGTYSSSKTNYNLAVVVDVSKKIYIGWNIFGMTVSDKISSPSVTQKYAAADMGPCFRWKIDSKKMYSLNFAYLLSSTTTFTNSSTTEKWRGVPMLVRFSIEPEISEKMHMGLSLGYYMMSATEKVVTNTTSTVSYSRNWIYPSFSLSYYF